MVDLIDEIKEDLQQEKYAQLWHKYSNYIIGFLVAIVLSTVVFVWWKNHSSSKSEELGNDLYRAFVTEKGKNPEASLDLYKAIEQKGGAAASVASLREAGLLLSSDKNDEALAIYKSISDGKSPDEVKDLAYILYAYNSIETSDNAEILAKLKSMTEKDSAFKYSAKELIAFYEFRLGKYDEAKKLFQELSDDMYTPAKMKARSGEMIGAIEAKGKDVNVKG
ncbi:MAG: hypothetical protein K0R98_1782 [Rickettsiaceae bacterium]|nr:hypothetical protein [Rickettsiaceae bacterium]